MYNHNQVVECLQVEENVIQIATEIIKKCRHKEKK